MSIQLPQSPTSSSLPDRLELARYAREDLRGEPIYRGYKPRTALVEEVASTLPNAHMVIVSGAWCPDCRREVPKMARVLELLPEGWSVDFTGDEQEMRDLYGVMAIPTFLVFDRPGGTEIGRIVEGPEGDQGLEGDLLEIARKGAADPLPA